MKMIVSDLPPPQYKSTSRLTTKTPIQGSPLTYWFLGQYYYMYDKMVMERTIPSWKDLEWLVEDYGLSITKDAPNDEVYLHISSN